MTSDVSQLIFLLPKNKIEEKYSVIRLKHPRTGSTALCALDSSHKLYEIVHYTEEFSSWFVDNYVVQDGSLYLMTVVDPLFFILPYVNQDKKYCPLEDLLVDGDFSDVHNLVKSCDANELLNIFDSKESSGFKVFCYNKTITLHWLQQKAKYLASSLKNKNINLTDGSKSTLLRSNDEKENPEILLSYSCHLVSDYITDELSIELFKSLGLQMKKDKPKNEDNLHGNAKKPNTSVSPTDDYSKKFSMNSLQEKQKNKLTAAQKQLMKVDKKGMKSISSFFQKK